MLTPAVTQQPSSKARRARPTAPTLRTKVTPPLPSTPAETKAPSDAERLASFAAAIDAIRARIEAEVGAEDVRYIERMRRLSTTCEVTGRTLIHVSLEPVTFFAGVTALWLHKQLEATEIGHGTLHGAYDGLPGAEAFQSKTFWWKTPIDEESWREVHNVRHHYNTNVAGKDPDIHFGPMRLNEQTPWALPHAVQTGFAFFLASNFGSFINLQYTGVVDYFFGNGRPEQFDFISDRSPETRKKVLGRAFRKILPYYAREYGLFPALAGPFFGKVLLGNWLSETARDLYSAATIYCGHVGEDVTDYAEGQHARGRAQWYEMQVAATNDFEVPLWVSVLCGALDRQIEHHLFPKLPPNRLREVAPEVRKACEDHGIPYKTDTWGKTLGKVFRRIHALSKRDA